VNESIKPISDLESVSDRELVILLVSESGKILVLVHDYLKHFTLLITCNQFFKD